MRTAGLREELVMASWQMLQWMLSEREGIWGSCPVVRNTNRFGGRVVIV